MTEQLLPPPSEQQLNHSEYTTEVRPAPERFTPDWRRFDVATNRFGDRLADGIAAALDQQQGVDEDTARCMAHVLGRSLGRQNALADYGRTGTGYYEELREEYLSLYEHPEASPVAKELIDWFGTHLIHENFPNAQTTSASELYPVTLDRLLVPTEVEVGDLRALVHVPGNYGLRVSLNSWTP